MQRAMPAAATTEPTERPNLEWVYNAQTRTLRVDLLAECQHTYLWDRGAVDFSRINTPGGIGTLVISGVLRPGHFTSTGWQTRLDANPIIDLSSAIVQSEEDFHSCRRPFNFDADSIRSTCDFGENDCVLPLAHLAPTRVCFPLGTWSIANFNNDESLPASAQQPSKTSWNLSKLESTNVGRLTQLTHLNNAFNRMGQLEDVLRLSPILKKIRHAFNFDLNSTGSIQRKWSSDPLKHCSELTCIVSSFNNVPCASISIPATVETLEHTSFKGCFRLRTVNFLTDARTHTSSVARVDDHCFSDCAIRAVYNFECTRVGNLRNGCFSNNPLRFIALPATANIMETGWAQGLKDTPGNVACHLDMSRVTEMLVGKPTTSSTLLVGSPTRAFDHVWLSAFVVQFIRRREDVETPCNLLCRVAHRTTTVHCDDRHCARLERMFNDSHVACHRNPSELATLTWRVSCNADTSRLVGRLMSNAVVAQLGDQSAPSESREGLRCVEIGNLSEHMHCPDLTELLVEHLIDNDDVIRGPDVKHFLVVCEGIETDHKLYQVTGFNAFRRRRDAEGPGFATMHDAAFRDGLQFYMYGQYRGRTENERWRGHADQHSLRWWKTFPADWVAQVQAGHFSCVEIFTAVVGSGPRRQARRLGVQDEILRKACQAQAGLPTLAEGRCDPDDPYSRGAACLPLASKLNIGVFQRELDKPQEVQLGTLDGTRIFHLGSSGLSWLEGDIFVDVPGLNDSTVLLSDRERREWCWHALAYLKQGSWLVNFQQTDITEVVFGRRAWWRTALEGGVVD